MSTKKGHTPGKIAGGLAWTADKGGPAITVAGRMDRAALEATQVGIALPAELRTRVELLQEGGGINGALVGLLHFALDEIERQGVRLKIDLGA